MPSQVFIPEFKPTYLYIKQHSITGKLYFGKTTKDPEKYMGSGIHWTRHISKHGIEYVETVWYCLFLDKEDCVDFALNFSKQHDIVESKEWLNAIPENGTDDAMTNFPPWNKGLRGVQKWKPGRYEQIYTPETRAKMRAAKVGYVSWNKGRTGDKQSEETVEKRKQKLQGRPKPKVSCVFCRKVCSTSMLGRHILSAHK